MSQTPNTNDKGALANSYKGFEKLYNAVRMFFQMTIWLLLVMFVVQCLLIFAIYKINNDIFLIGLSKKDACIGKMYTRVWFKDLTSFAGNYRIIYNCEETAIETTRNEFVAQFKKPFKEHIRPKIIKNILMIFLITSSLYLLYIPVLRKFSKQHKEETKDHFLRGRNFLPEEKMLPKLLESVSEESINDPDKLRHQMYWINKKGVEEGNVEGSVGIPSKIMTRHNFIIGKPGSGKSQLIFRVVEQLLKNDVRCVIHDFKGDFIPLFYDSSKHLIFNPVDVRHMNCPNLRNERPDKFPSIFHKDRNDGKDKYSLGPENSTDVFGWTLFNELHTTIDMDAFVTSMIPESGKEAFWHMAPRDILKAILIYCKKMSAKDPLYATNKAVCEMLTLGLEKLRELFAMTEGCEDGSKHLGDVKLGSQLMSILSANTASLRYLVGTEGNFSINKWVAGEQAADKKVIFVANQAMVQETLKFLIATFFDFATKSLCSLPDDLNRRLCFVLDEFGQLSKIGSIVQLLTQSRSKGGCVFLLIQDRAQGEAIYGQELSKSIVNSCGNKFYFAVGDGSTAEYISKEIGNQELIRTKEGKSFGIKDTSDTINQNIEIIERPIVMPSEVMSIPSLNCFMDLTDLPTTKVNIGLIPTKNQDGVIGVELRNFTIKLSEEDKKRIEEARKQDEQEAQMRDAEKRQNEEAVEWAIDLEQTSGYSESDPDDVDIDPDEIEDDDMGYEKFRVQAEGLDSDKNTSLISSIMDDEGFSEE